MKSPRFVTIPWLLKQRTSDLVFVAGWLRDVRWVDTKQSKGLNDVMGALVRHIETELEMRDPRRALKRAADMKGRSE